MFHLPCTGWIQQRLDTDVLSAVTVKTETALRQRKRAQPFGSDGADSYVTALTVTGLTALKEQWKWQCEDNAVDFSLTAKVTDNAVTALYVATTFTVMCTSLPQYCQHRHSVVSVTAVTLVCTVMLQHCRCPRQTVQPSRFRRDNLDFAWKSRIPTNMRSG